MQTSFVIQVTTSHEHFKEIKRELKVGIAPTVLP